MPDMLEHITTLINDMSWSELQNTVLLLAEKNEHVRKALFEIWQKQEREARLRKGVEWTPADWLDARRQFEPSIDDELEQCAECFTDRYDYGYYDSDEGRFDFSEGLEQLEGWFAELLEMATDGQWIDGAVGLLLTLQRLDDWAESHGDEDTGGEELLDECMRFWPKAEELITIIRNSTAPERNKSAFFLALIDWVAGLCEESEDWSRWREPLRACLFSPEHYDRLKERVMRLEPNLFADTSREPVPADVVRWWVRASLDLGQETEAERAEAKLPAFDAETAASFAHYYERLGRTEEALARLQAIIQHIKEQLQQRASEPLRGIRSPYVPGQQPKGYFEWLITIYERTGRQTEAEAWRVQWFETLPSLELFQRCLSAVPPAERAHQAKLWIDHVNSLGRYRYQDLLINMYLHIGDPNGAWSVFQEGNHEASDWLSASARQLFETIKQHDPGRLVSVLRQYAEKRIAEKNRKSYQQAVEWLSELKSVYHLLDQTAAWTVYLGQLRENHRRLPALQDEIVKAKL